MADNRPTHGIEHIRVDFRGTGKEEAAKIRVWGHGLLSSIGLRPLARFAAEVDVIAAGSEYLRMQYLVITEVSPEDVLQRARDFFSEHSRLHVEETAADSLRFTGELGTADLRVDRHHGHTNVHVETDRVAGLDITDLSKRFLYTLGHI